MFFWNVFISLSFLRDHITWHRILDWQFSSLSTLFLCLLTSIVSDGQSFHNLIGIPLASDRLLSSWWFQDFLLQFGFQHFYCDVSVWYLSLCHLGIINKIPNFSEILFTCIYSIFLYYLLNLFLTLLIFYSEFFQSTVEPLQWIFHFSNCSFHSKISIWLSVKWLLNLH